MSVGTWPGMACSYGAHPFVRKPLPDFMTPGPRVGTHMHYCPDCGAEYFAFDPCPCEPAS